MNEYDIAELAYKNGHKDCMREVILACWQSNKLKPLIQEIIGFDELKKIIKSGGDGNDVH